jgi:Synergist-CTERM protein sorting domain-containing protein
MKKVILVFGVLAALAVACVAFAAGHDGTVVINPPVAVQPVTIAQDVHTAINSAFSGVTVLAAQPVSGASIDHAAVTAALEDLHASETNRTVHSAAVHPVEIPSSGISATVTVVFGVLASDLKDALKSDDLSDVKIHLFNVTRKLELHEDVLGYVNDAGEKITTIPSSGNVYAVVDNITDGNDKHDVRSLAADGQIQIEPVFTRAESNGGGGGGGGCDAGFSGFALLAAAALAVFCKKSK